MTKFFLAATALLTVATPAFAREATRTFTRDGVTYSYTVSNKDGDRVIEGSSDGERFRLVVSNGWVSGVAGGTRVSFRAPKAADVQVAQR